MKKTKQQLENEIRKLEEQIKELETKEIKTLKIPELNIEVTKEVLHKNKTTKEMIELIPKGWRLLSLCREKDKVNEVIWLCNSKYSKELKMDNSSTEDDFLIEQPFNINKKLNLYAFVWFNNPQIGSKLDCRGRGLYGGISAFGVRFVRDLT